MDMISIDQVIEDFESMTKDAGRAQRETLKKILEENGSAEYLQNLGLDGRTDQESLKTCVPLVSHNDLEHHIQRIMDGDLSPVLTGKPIKTISLSSGTTQGKPKYVPFNDELVDQTVQMNQTSFAFRNRQYPIACGKALQFIYASKQFKTKGGLYAATATTNLFHSSKYRTTMKSRQWQCSPDEVILSQDVNQSLYCHLLCGLFFWFDVQLVSSTFAFSIVQAFRSFEQVWEELCKDIREGVLSNRITVTSIREAMSELVKPDPELAELIYKKFSGLTNWYGLIPTLFPNAKYVYGIMTGSMLPYIKKLRHYAGDLPLLSGDYGSSEMWIGANVNPQLPPELATFAVIPNIGYFEFIPLGKNTGVYVKNNGDSLGIEPKTVGLTEVTIGEEYEIIITNFAGLYRYRLGDVVKVTGFHNSTPELQVIRRKNLLLNINIDKNTENDLELALETAAKLLDEGGLEVIDFTSHVDVSKEPGHYVISWELNGEASQEVMEESCNCMDRSFIDAGYVSARKSNSIGPLELRVLRRGTFQKVLNHYLGLGAAASQFKTPRCVGPANEKLLQILHDNCVECYFSTAFK